MGKQWILLFGVVAIILIVAVAFRVHGARKLRRMRQLACPDCHTHFSVPNPAAVRQWMDFDVESGGSTRSGFSLHCDRCSADYRFTDSFQLVDRKEPMESPGIQALKATSCLTPREPFPEVTMALTEISTARKSGHVRFHRIYQYPVDLNRILAMCYLKPEADRLLEIGRDEAIRVIVCWLHRDAAYRTELMPLEQAQRIAEGFIREYSDETSRFFTNGRWDDSKRPQSWQPLTETVFDGGVIIASGRGNDTQHTCLWFEDED